MLLFSTNPEYVKVHIRTRKEHEKSTYMKRAWKEHEKYNHLSFVAHF